MVDTFRAYRRLLRNRRLARLLFGEFVSSVGDWLYLVALLIIVYEESHDAVALSLVGAARVVPYLLLAVPAGIVADRFDRRVILLVTDVVRGVLQIVLALLVVTDAPLAAVVAVAIASACLSAFFGPAIAAYMPSVVDDPADLGTANAAWATLDNLAYFIGPAVAGLLIASGGAAVAFLLNGLTFALVTAVMFGLPSGRSLERSPTAPDAAAPSAEPAKAESLWSLAREISGMVALDAATGMVGGGLSVLTVVVAVDTLAGGAEVTGFLNAATGVGGMVAGIVAGALVMRRLDLPIGVSAVVGGVGLWVLAVNRDVGLALVAIAIAAGALLLLDVLNATILQRAVPDAMRGRAAGLLQVAGYSAMSVGALVFPLVADRFGVSTALTASGVIGAILSFVGLALLRPTGVLAAAPRLRS